jgi:short-subunit dehydrogenase
MSDPESRPVVVITGASSGVGLATAVAFAKSRARLVLAARDEGAGADVAARCRALRSEALFYPTDVSHQDAMESLRRYALDTFGRIDVWVNCAAVLSFGRLEDTPAEILRRVIEVNVLGYIYGSKSALSQFRTQGYGTLINVGSLLGMASEPFASAYVASKFAIRGLTSCLRQEVRDAPRIHVCAVLPAALDTPIYQHAANYMGRAARSIFPVHDAEKVANAILRLSRRPKRQVIISGFGHLIAQVPASPRH